MHQTSRQGLRRRPVDDDDDVAAASGADLGLRRPGVQRYFAAA